MPYYNFKYIISLLCNFYILLLLIELCFSPVFVSLLLFWIHKWSPDICNRRQRYFNIGLVFDCLVFFFSWVTVSDTLRVLKPVLCFHLTSFNYGANEIKDVYRSCRCHWSSIMPDSIFSVNILQCVICG